MFSDNVRHDVIMFLFECTIYTPVQFKNVLIDKNKAPHN